MDELLGKVADSLEEGTVPARIFNDPQVHRLEMERIFTRCWVFVGHVSEIASPGDYMLRYIGQDEFIVTRDENNEIHVLFNRCAHRGSPICRVEKGNATHFRCPYHAWIYKNNGEWNGAPLRARAYRKLDPKEWGLQAAPLVDTVHGLIFACLDPEGPTLREYLGDMAWYLDVIFGLSPEGMSVIGEPQRWQVPTNWKMGADNFVGDSYHVASLHRSIEEVGAFPDIDVTGGNGPGKHVSFPQGHGLLLNSGYLPEPWDKGGFPPEVSATFDLDRLTPLQREFVAEHAVTHLLIFPNLAFLRVPAVTAPGEMPAVFTLLRQWQPLESDQVVNWNWMLRWNSAPEEFNETGYIGGLSQHGPSGILEQDDGLAWSGAPDVGRSAFARKREVKFNYQLGFDGMSDYSVDTEYPYPGTATTTMLGELPQLTMYRRWLKEMVRA
ncbi:aromatic ring-hydroxylating oxygenase subunit alpha [Nocardia sp. CA-290969]|uniref:aromatic ring-hydroxylating oxygenase subunit alpha n=1 Tax=Nocardia sp. CA-290969 TaxID=3239986 RepID=UPI003D90FAC9